MGKSSYGWQFHFAFNDGDYYKDVDVLRAWLKDKSIFDEYDRHVSEGDFWKMVESKQATTNPSDGHFMIIGGYRFMNSEFS